MLCMAEFWTLPSKWESLRTNVVELENVSVSYNSHPVLKEITLRVDSGEKVVLIGSRYMNSIRTVPH